MGGNMATVINVHGTFAHAGSPPEAPAGAMPEPQWWQQEGAFQKDLRELVEVPDGTLEVASFEWSGDNSEVARRDAGYKLLRRLRELEAKNEPYCLVGHSHGGSVISTALLAGAARNQPLNNLKRWVTVGTPFVNYRRERLLFTRLGLLSRIAFVASMMLFLMLAVHVVWGYATGQELLFGRSFQRVLFVTAILMSAPAILIYIVLLFIDRRRLLLFRPRVTERARQNFGSRWVSLAHPDDEAIQGLAFLPGAKLYFFDKAFAVSAITAFSVFALPILYLALLATPPAMVGIADWLDTRLYASRSTPEAEKELRDLQEKLRAARAATKARGKSPSNQARRATWAEYRRKRQELEARHPNLESAQRSLRFKQRFFERDGKPCEGGKLCGGGEDFHVNSGLLLHVATDELSWAFGAEEARDRRQRGVWSLLLPALLIPVIAGLIALVLMLLIRGLAGVFSNFSSGILNKMTNAEVKRAAFGNDTEGEIAVGAVDRPVWIARSQPRLPAALSDLITAYSNGIAVQSFAKFRKAIGQLAMTEPKHTADTAISTYFTWKELVHASYFDVPELRKLVAQAIGRTEGFAPSARFRADPDFARTEQWLAAIEKAPVPPADATPGSGGPREAAAVSAVVASTVKAEP
jgi:hypothetical protein